MIVTTNSTRGLVLYIVIVARGLRLLLSITRTQIKPMDWLVHSLHNQVVLGTYVHTRVFKRDLEKVTRMIT